MCQPRYSGQRNPEYISRVFSGIFWKCAIRHISRVQVPILFYSRLCYLHCICLDREQERSIIHVTGRLLFIMPLFSLLCVMETDCKIWTSCPLYYTTSLCIHWQGRVARVRLILLWDDAVVCIKEQHVHYYCTTSI